MVAELGEPLGRALLAALERHEGDDRLARASIRPQTAASATLVVDERALDLDRRDPVAGDVHDVVYAPEQPEVPVLVDPRAVSREIDAGIARPVGLPRSDRVSCRSRGAWRHGFRGRGSRHLRPDLVALFVEDGGVDPRNGFVAEPGFSVVDPEGVIRIIPVSVCHHVSTTGTRSPPMCCRYQTQASGLIGSPTVPSSRIEERSCFAAYSGPHFMWLRIAVGAV